MIQKITCKLGNMRKAKEWVVYPQATNKDPDGTFLIQCDTRIAKVDAASCKAILSVNKPSGAYCMHLSPSLGATIVDVPKELVEAIKEAQPKSGDHTGQAVYIA